MKKLIIVLFMSLTSGSTFALEFQKTIEDIITENNTKRPSPQSIRYAMTRCSSLYANISALVNSRKDLAMPAMIAAQKLASMSYQIETEMLKTNGDDAVKLITHQVESQSKIYSEMMVNSRNLENNAFANKIVESDTKFCKILAEI